MRIFIRIFVSITALTRQSHTGQSFPKNFFRKGVQLYFEISADMDIKMRMKKRILFQGEANT